LLGGRGNDHATGIILNRHRPSGSTFNSGTLGLYTLQNGAIRQYFDILNLCWLAAFADPDLLIPDINPEKGRRIDILGKYFRATATVNAFMHIDGCAQYGPGRIQRQCISSK
jgi:hypothetical protein